MTQSLNPLKQFFRQPAIYLRLPSKGIGWEKDSLDMPENGELPIYPMTAIDEITYRTPDALYNGGAIVNVIQSCVPCIKNGWAIPNLDLNAILVGVRNASYGHELELSTTCPACSNNSDYSIDLRLILDRTVSPDYNDPIKQGDLEIYFKPLSYRDQNEINLLQFEQQRVIQLLPDSSIDEKEKIIQLNNALKEIGNITIKAIQYAIGAIKTPDALVTEREYISEWLANCDSALFNKIRDHVIGLREKSELPMMDLECTECHNKYKQPFTLDSASFFGIAS